MKVTIAEHSGYCFGVERAISIIDNLRTEDNVGSVFTLGEIIHNGRVVKSLADRGIVPISDIRQADRGDTVVIRAHGATSDVYEYANSNGIKIIDATCPLVEKRHKIVEDKAHQGKAIIIFGDENHPEVQGIKGRCKGAIDVKIVSDVTEFNCSENTVVVVQTTYNTQEWQRQVELIKNKSSNLDVYNTICFATAARQNAAIELAQKSDLMLIAGDKKSSNTNKLFELCEGITKTKFLENVDDLAISELDNIDSIGIIGGASTPSLLINEIVTKIIGREEPK